MFSISAHPPAPPSCRPPADSNPTSDLKGFGPSLTEKCHFYLANGLTPSTLKVYSSANAASKNFALWTIIFLHQPQCCQPIKETVKLLLSSCRYSSLKVSLSEIHSLHIKQGLLDPLVGRLQLQRVLRGIKHHQGSNQPKRQPIPSDLLWVNVIPWIFLITTIPCSGPLAVLTTLVFYVQGSSPSTLRLTTTFTLQSAIFKQIHSLIQAASGFTSKCFKTDPFRHGCLIYIGTGKPDLCPVRAITHDCISVAPILPLCFSSQMAHH